MRWYVILAIVVVLVLVGIAIAVRVIPMEPLRWHVRPADAAEPDTPNYTLRRGDDAILTTADPPHVADAIEAAAQDAGWQKLAGTAAGGFVTYVARSTLFGFPDAISITLEPQGGGTRVEIFARARYGRSDLGVNARHVERIATALP